MNLRILALLSASGVVPLACSAPTSSAQATALPGLSDCDTIAASAASEVAGSMSSHAACASDADCVSVSFGASCFDRCSRSMNAAGKPDMEAATERVEAAQCKEFARRGCKLVPPPCMAPRPPRCQAGTCV